MCRYPVPVRGVLARVRDTVSRLGFSLLASWPHEHCERSPAPVRRSEHPRPVVADKRQKETEALHITARMAEYHPY